MSTENPVVRTPPLATASHHPEYAYWAPEWQTIRDVIVGESQLKKLGEKYLPKPEAMTKQEYLAYIRRAVFYNMTARTIVGLQGTIFRRPARVNNMPERLKEAAQKISNYNQPLDTLVKQTTLEICSLGRSGALLDMPATGGTPYISAYIAENIVDWSEEEINGKLVTTEIVLRELRLERIVSNTTLLAPRPKNGMTVNKRWYAAYRVLKLEPEIPGSGNRIYRQYYYWKDHGDADITQEPTSIVTPNWREKPFDFIPFVFFGPMDNKPAVQKSPVLDIVNLNLSHFMNYAQLEQGRFYTAQPIYYVPTKDGETRGSYTLGPSVVWEIAADAGAPGILEYHGSGLQYLQQGCAIKEEQISTLGGRMVGLERTGPGQSDNKVKMQEANESAMLLNISFVVDYGFTQLLKWWVYWQDGTQQEIDAISYECNKSFVLSQASAREFRAIQMMYQAGVIPIEVLYEYLMKAEVIPEWMDFNKFKDLLDQEGSFPNQADVHAKMDGAPDAQAVWDAAHPTIPAATGFNRQPKPKIEAKPAVKK